MAVKLEMGSPDPAKPDEGQVHFFVDWYGHISPLFFCSLSSYNRFWCAHIYPQRTAFLNCLLSSCSHLVSLMNPNSHIHIHIHICATYSSASASPLFEGRGGELLSIEISRTLEAMICNSHALDVKSLCIIPSEQVWHVYVDAMVRIFPSPL